MPATGEMVIGGLSPLNRVHEILQRMIDNPRHVESLKTCCGVLAILSRDEANKLLIARDGIRLICSIMEQHVERHDLLEAACDLLWSLAFNNTLLKEVIGQQGGIPVIIRGMKMHPSSADFLKSACGALSNMCQNAHNQTLISTHGGIYSMLQILENHRENTILLPFVFDAMASLIVGNQENGRKLAEAGAIPTILTLMEEHMTHGELAKSGCHALAILSDNRGMGGKIAHAGGVRVILPVLREHPQQVDLHRVAAVVVLRMLQEAPVAGEMARSKGVPLMLSVLDDQLDEVETVAAGCHILYSITHAQALKGPPVIDLESQLKQAGIPQARAHSVSTVSGITGSGITPSKSPMKNGKANKDATTPADAGTLSWVLRKHSARKDVARACVRSIMNLSRFPTALASLLAANVLEPMLVAVSLHSSARDVIEGTLNMLKMVAARQPSPPKTTSSSSSSAGIGLSESCVAGMLACVKARPGDAKAAAIIFSELEVMVRGPKKQPSTQMAPWEQESVKVSLTWARLHGNPTMSPVGGAATSEDTMALAEALTALCRFLYSFASKLPPGLAALRMLDTATIVRNLEARVRQQMSGDVGNMVRVAVNTLLSLIGQNNPAGTAVLPGSSEHVPGSHTPLGSSAANPTGNGTLAAGSLNEGPPGSTSGGAMHRSGVAGSHEGGDQEGSQALVPGGGGTLVGGANRSTEYKPPLKGSEARRAAGIRDVSRPRGSTNAGAGTSPGPSRRRLEAGDGSSAASPAGGAGDRETPGSVEPMERFCNCGRRDLKGRKRPRPRHPNDEECQMLWTTPKGLEPILMTNTADAATVQALAFHDEERSLDSRRMHVVYEGCSAAGRGLHSRVPTPVPYVVPGNGLGEPFDHSVTFDACFESGNLLRAVQKGAQEYDLFLRADLHTEGHMQWFYFSISDTHPEGADPNKEVKIKFNIVNLTKPDSLFNQGLQPVLYSCNDAETKGIGWRREGSEICYFSNPYPRTVSGQNTCGEGVGSYFTLTFTISFPKAGDTVLLAHAYPYTYADHKAHLASLMSKPCVRKNCQHTVMCESLDGNDLDLLTITEDLKDDFTLPTGSEGRTTVRRKRCIVFTGRVHPGEAQASWMMKGILDFLTGDSTKAKLLRHLFVFKIVPMLNPDGVIYGNNRCSLAGVDLNRQWKKPSRTVHPTIYYTKSLIRSEKAMRDVVMYIDLHGHSRKMNVFMYGCDDKKKPKPMVRVFPKLMSWNNIGRQYLSFSDCNFSVKKARETTARVVVARELGIPNAYTLEATFAGANFGPLANMHLNSSHHQEVGFGLCDTLLDYFLPNTQQREELMTMMRMHGGNRRLRLPTEVSPDKSTGAGSPDSHHSQGSRKANGTRGDGDESVASAASGGSGAKRDGGGSPVKSPTSAAANSPGALSNNGTADAPAAPEPGAESLGSPGSLPPVASPRLSSSSSPGTAEVGGAAAPVSDGEEVMAAAALEGLTESLEASGDLAASGEGLSAADLAVGGDGEEEDIGSDEDEDPGLVAPDGPVADQAETPTSQDGRGTVSTLDIGSSESSSTFERDQSRANGPTPRALAARPGSGHGMGPTSALAQTTFHVTMPGDHPRSAGEEPVRRLSGAGVDSGGESSEGEGDMAAGKGAGSVGSSSSSSRRGGNSSAGRRSKLRGTRRRAPSFPSGPGARQRKPTPASSLLQQPNNASKRQLTGGDKGIGKVEDAVAFPAPGGLTAPGSMGLAMRLRGDGEAMGTNGNAPMAQPRLSKGGPGLGGKLNGKTTIPQLWDNSGLGEKDLNWVGEPGGELNAGGEGPSGGGPGSSRGDTPESHREAAVAALETFGGGVLAGQGVGGGVRAAGRGRAAAVAARNALSAEAQGLAGLLNRGGRAIPTPGGASTLPSMTSNGALGMLQYNSMEQPEGLNEEGRIVTSAPPVARSNARASGAGNDLLPDAHDRASGFKDRPALVAPRGTNGPLGMASGPKDVLNVSAMGPASASSSTAPRSHTGRRRAPGRRVLRAPNA